MGEINTELIATMTSGKDDDDDECLWDDRRKKNRCKTKNESIFVYLAAFQKVSLSLCV